MGVVLADCQWDLTYAGAYRVSADRGTITLLANDFALPNGLAFSLDESVLCIVDWQRDHIRAFDVAPNGMLAKQRDRIFADLRGPEPGAPDGMKVDTAGDVYSGGSGGIYILDPKGEPPVGAKSLKFHEIRRSEGKRARPHGGIVHGYPETTNTFGGDDWKNPLFHYQEHAWVSELKDCRPSGAYAEKMVIEFYGVAATSWPARKVGECDGTHIT